MFLFKTHISMKDYNDSKYWIDSNLIKEFRADTDNLEYAVDDYHKFVNNISNSGIEISFSALRNKQPMYIDDESGNTKQIGYVITGKTYIDGKQVYIDIWAEVLKVEHPF